MKLAKKTNNIVVVNNYITIPDLNVLCGVENLSIEFLNSNDYYLVEDVAYDNILQYLGDWYLDNNIAKQVIVDKTFGTLQEEKDKRITYIKQKYYNLLSPTDWYVVRYMEKHIQVPFEITQERDTLRYECESKINDINNLNTIKDIIQYE